MTLENVRHRLPSGTIGEGAVDQNNSLHGRVRRGRRGKSGACKECQNQAFHGEAPPMFVAKTDKRRLESPGRLTLAAQFSRPHGTKTRVQQLNARSLSLF